MTLHQIESLLCTILETSTIFRASRFHLHILAQQVGQPMREYVQTLRSQSTKCQYDSFFDEALIDQLISGIHDNSSRKRLLSTEKFTFGEAVKIAIHHELVERDSNEL